MCRDWGNLRWEELCEEGHVGEVLPMVVELVAGGGHSLIHASPQVPGTVLGQRQKDRQDLPLPGSLLLSNLRQRWDQKP